MSGLFVESGFGAARLWPGSTETFQKILTVFNINLQSILLCILEFTELHSVLNTKIHLVIVTITETEQLFPLPAFY